MSSRKNCTTAMFAAACAAPAAPGPGRAQRPAPALAREAWRAMCPARRWRRRLEGFAALVEDGEDGTFGGL